MSDAPFIAEFLQLLAKVPSGAGQFDPWQSTSHDDACSEAAASRRDRLRRHLTAERVDFLAIGECPGYAGARVSGMAFTSEALLLDGAIPRVAVNARLTTRHLPWSEPSARIMWEILYRHGIAETTLLWNVAPVHAHRPGEPLSNRTPTAAEIEAGRPLVECLVRHHPQARVLAIGGKSAALLGRMGIEHVALRHPAYGGKPELEKQVEALMRRVAGDVREAG